MVDQRTICWFSAGAASAIATQLTLKDMREGEVVICRCDTGAEHEDNDRFEADCAAWFGQEIITLKNDEYKDTWDVWEKTRWLAGIKGARCTSELKIIPRQDFQRVEGDSHVFGYTADSSDVARAKRLTENHFELTIETPLIERGLTKAACIKMLSRAGIAPPITYAMGFHNANCLPCVKATSPNYWALIRKEFPDKFDRMARLSRDLGVRLARVKGDRVFIDEIPADWPTTDPIVADCDFLCAIAERDISDGE